MKKISVCFAMMVLGLLMAVPGVWGMDNDVKEMPACIHCGMNREMFAHSRMLIEYNDGSKVGLCSLHCAAVDMALNLDKTPSAIRVGDYKKKELIDAEKAFWVIGGSKPGVMTKNAKWAFADKADADAFMMVNGGRLGSFDEALQTAYVDLGNDTKMIREKRKMMKMKMSDKH